MEVTLQPWCRRFSRLMGRWQREDNPEVAGFLLRGSGDLQCIPPVSHGICVDGDLVGRHTYRYFDGLVVPGIYLSPPARNKGIAIPAARIGLELARAAGAVVAQCSVAAPNRAAVWFNAQLGYKLLPVGEWRTLPDGFDLRLLQRWHTDYWRYLPVPAVYYHFMELDLSGASAAEGLYPSPLGATPSPGSTGDHALVSRLNIGG